MKAPLKVMIYKGCEKFPTNMGAPMHPKFEGELGDLLRESSFIPRDGPQIIPIKDHIKLFNSEDRRTMLVLYHWENTDVEKYENVLPFEVPLGATIETVSFMATGSDIAFLGDLGEKLQEFYQSRNYKGTFEII